MAAGGGIYLTWIAGAIILSLAMMPLFKPSYAKISISGFIDMFRRYWAHMIIVFSVYLWKDLLDQLDRILMANTQLDMTPYVYAVEGDIVLWIQDALQNSLLSIGLTHFYVMGFMMATFASFIYPIYFDDRFMADRVSLSMFWVYILAIPFYLFFNVRVTGDFIPQMETIAYDLTPEIHDWFTRIDPFTNGMPSLHIGLPFAIWLTMETWDQDDRWLNYRRFLLAFIALTGFTILYLGIHWVLDIIGGILVATLAVRITERTQETIWTFADERLFSRRLARAIEDPKAWLWQVRISILRAIQPIRQPSSTQTKAFIAGLLLVTGTVLLWDATHQAFPIEGANPTSAVGSEGWVVGIEESEGGEISVSVWNVSDQASMEVGGQSWASIPNAEISGNHLVLFYDQRIDYFELTEISEEVLLPTFSRLSIETIEDLTIGKSIDGEPFIAYVENGSLVMINDQQEVLDFGEESAIYSQIDASGAKIAWAIQTDLGPAINISAPFNPGVAIHIMIEEFSDDLIDEHLSEIYDEDVDYNSSLIIDLAMDGEYVVAVVDVGPVNRIILIDTVSGEQILLSVAGWPASSPSIGEGRIAFLQTPRFDPTEQVLDETPRDVFLHDIALNLTTQITHDEDVDQAQPHVLDNGVAWIETDEDGVAKLQIHSLEKTFEPYSSVVLQSAIVMLIPLILVWTHQVAVERRG